MIPGRTVAGRALVLGAGLTLWYLTQALIGGRPPVAGIGDRVHDLPAAAHGWLEGSPKVTNALLIAGSLGIDLIGLGLLGWGLFGRNARPLAGVLALFAFRQLAQSLTALPPPPGMLWRDPGFPSLLVTYGVGNDFFFSGHTALAVFGALEFSRWDRRALTVATAAVAVGEIALVLVLRTHYTMDVWTGAAMAFAVWMSLNRWWPQGEKRHE